MVTFWDRLEEFGSRNCLTALDGEEATYEQLAARADAFFNYPAGTLVLLSLDNSVASIVAYLSALRRRLPAILVNLEQADLAARLTERFAPRISWDPVKGVREIAPQRSAPATHPDVAILLSTSGSTGATKLVRISREALDANCKSIVQCLSIEGSQRAITSLPPGYSYGLSVINSHLDAGASIVLSKLSLASQEFREAVVRHRVTSLAGVPYSYGLLEKSGFLANLPVSLRTLTAAGGRLPPEQARRIGVLAQAAGARLFVMYGQTEATARIACHPPSMLAAHPDAVGSVIPRGEIVLRDPDTGEATTGIGEMFYRGPNVMMGYADGPRDLARGHEVDWLATGDIAECLPNGIYRIVGRKSRIIKPFGRRVALDQVEELLSSRGIDAVATGDDDLLVLGTLADRSVEAAEIAGSALSLPAHAVAVVPLREIPRLDNGKIDYAAVCELGRAAQAKERSARYDVGKGAILRAFCEALRLTSVPGHASFHDLAGDSLAYVCVSIAIEEELGCLPKGWERMPVAELDRRARGSSPASNRNWRWTATEIPVRAVAITMIILVHAIGGASASFMGGAFVLLLLAGYSMARFQYDCLISDERLSIIERFAVRIVLPYYAILIVYGLFSANRFALPSMLLVNNVWPDAGVVTMTTFWFVQALWQFTLAIVLLFYVPWIRTFAGRAPWPFAVCLVLFGACLLQFGPTLLLPLRARDYEFRSDLWFFVFALGWLVAAADTVPRKIAAIATTALLASNHWSLLDSHTLSGTAAVAALLFAPRVKLWTPLVLVTGIIAQSTYFIYLTQGITINILRDRLDYHSAPLIVASALLVGVAGRFGWDYAVRLLTGWAARESKASVQGALPPPPR